MSEISFREYVSLLQLIPKQIRNLRFPLDAQLDSQIYMRVVVFCNPLAICNGLHQSRLEASSDTLRSSWDRTGLLPWFDQQNRIQLFDLSLHRKLLFRPRRFRPCKLPNDQRHRFSRNREQVLPRFDLDRGHRENDGSARWRSPLFQIEANPFETRHLE